MTSLSPLQIGAATVNDIIGSKVCVEADDTDFGFTFNDPQRSDLPPYETMFVWRKARLGLEFGVAVHFDLAPLRNKERVCTMLNNNVRPFLNGLYDGPGQLVLHSEFDTIVPVYEVQIDYAPLEDGEITRVVERSLIRAMRTLLLLVPVFQCIERGFIPTTEKQTEFLMLGHGIWEVNASTTDVPEHAVRFPPGFFGGIGTPRAQ